MIGLFGEKKTLYFNVAHFSYASIRYFLKYEYRSLQVLDYTELLVTFRKSKIQA